jgi:hypothetical protein
LKQDGIWTGSSRAGLPIHSMVLQQQFWVNTVPPFYLEKMLLTTQTANATCPAPVVNVNVWRSL